MITKKKEFISENFCLKCGEKITLRLGYETYGKLSEKKDNAVLVSHYFTATSHAAGVYSTETGETAGYWDALIGEGKAVDTTKYFVVAADNICNVQGNNPNVITTGPASINPETGKAYGLSFPVISIADIAESQKRLLESLGIKHIKAAMGPSMGGMVGMQLAIHHPDFMDKYIGVVTAPRNAISPSFQYNAWHAAMADPNFRNGDYYDGAPPLEAQEILWKNLLLTIYTPSYLETLFPRDFKDEVPYRSLRAEASFEKKLTKLAKLSTEYFDLNSWIYAAHALKNHDIRHGFNSLEEACSRMKADVLMVSNKQDMLENWELAEEMVQAINAAGGCARHHLLDDELGHMAGIMKGHLFAEEVRAFLEE